MRQPDYLGVLLLSGWLTCLPSISLLVLPLPLGCCPFLFIPDPPRMSRVEPRGLDFPQMRFQFRVVFAVVLFSIEVCSVSALVMVPFCCVFFLLRFQFGMSALCWRSFVSVNDPIYVVGLSLSVYQSLISIDHIKGFSMGELI